MPSFTLALFLSMLPMTHCSEIANRSSEVCSPQSDIRPLPRLRLRPEENVLEENEAPLAFQEAIIAPIVEDSYRIKMRVKSVEKGRLRI
jgi:hypothetical protein